MTYRHCGDDLPADCPPGVISCKAYSGRLARVRGDLPAAGNDLLEVGTLVFSPARPFARRSGVRRVGGIRSRAERFAFADGYSMVVPVHWPGRQRGKSDSWGDSRARTGRRARG